MKRIIVICEGQTEQAFVKTNLYSHLLSMDTLVEAPLIKASHGGIVKWPKLKKEIENYLHSDKSAWVTTLIDYYGVYAKHDFPLWNDAEKILDKNKMMDAIEAAMHSDLDTPYNYRFIPYMQLHEFEGLLFNDVNVIYEQIPADDIVQKAELEKIFHDYPNPEMINNGRETAPSKRLERLIKGYHKIVYGDILAEAIGLNRIRNKSPRFNHWLSRLESIS
jgi:hypothetical protein